MDLTKPTAVIIVLGSVVALTASGLAQRSATAPAASVTPANTISRIVSSAQALLSTLDEAGRAKVQFPFEGPQKTRWSNFPSGIFQREGLRLGDLTPAQRTAVNTLLSTALSRDGYRKVTEIMGADEALRMAEGSAGTSGPGGRADGRGPGPGGRGARGGPGGPGGAGGRGGQGGRGGGGGGGVKFGADEYYLAFVGTPSASAPWMLQFGGHHLAINLTLGGSQASMTPSLPATQPASYTLEGRTIRPLGDENDKGFALINALDGAQRAQAILNYRVADLVLGPEQDGRTIQPEGIRASALSASQQAMLLDLVREWSGIMNEAFAQPRIEEIRANLPQTYFAWSGPTTNGSAAYFRIQGPTVVIEYAPQGGTDHIHTIYRDPTNDYGAKFTRK